jgi:hypothetical protein
MRIFPQTPAFFFGVFDTHTREATAKMIPSAHGEKAWGEEEKGRERNTDELEFVCSHKRVSSYCRDRAHLCGLDVQ